MDDKQQTGWDYKPSGAAAVADRPATQTTSGAGNPPNAPMVWTASEFIEHERGFGWYLVLIFSTVAVAAITYLLTKDFIAVGVIVVVGIIAAIAVGRKPRQLQYQLTANGIQVGEKQYNYSEFRSFSIIREENLSSIQLTPIKKFMIPVSAYFGPGDEERIVDIIGQHLPYEERQMELVDRLSRRLRF